MIELGLDRALTPHRGFLLALIRAGKFTATNMLKVLSEVISLPRADLAKRILSLEAEQEKLVQSLRGTSLNLKTFLPLAISGHVPSHASTVRRVSSSP